jgi:tetratricopeptide (TPR) repeat protein
MPSAYWIWGGLLAYAFNRHADAVTLGEKAAALDPGNPRYPCWVAGRYLDLGDEGRATRIVQVARERWPDADAPLRVSSFLHLFRGDLEGAVQDARKILARDSRVDLALRMVRDADLKKGDDAIARARYAKAYPEFFATELPRIDGSNLPIAIDLVLVLQKTGASVRASVLLDRIEKFIRTIPRMGGSGYGITDVQIYALRAQRREALSALRATEKAGYRFGWRYYRDFDPDLASIRNEPEFKAVFADIERDMARQRAELAARRRNAPLDFKMPSH